MSRSTTPPLRRARRRASTADEDSIERASRMVAIKNLEMDKGKNFDNSILSFSNEHIIDNLSNVGISMGREVRTVQSSMSLIKEVEKDRFILPSVKTIEDSHLDTDIEDSESEIDHLALGHLCGDLTEELMDDTSTDHILVSAFRKNKKAKNVKLQPSGKGQATKNQTIHK